MNTRRGGLGRGLGALIPGGDGAETALAVPDQPYAGVGIDGTTPVARYAEIDATLIDPNPQQPRQVFDDDALDELAASMREVGVLQPIVVRETGSGRFQLVMGERRWRAAQRIGLPAVPAIVRRTDDADMLRDALLENLQRQQLNPLEEAAAYEQLLQEFGATHDELATRIGRSRPHISNTLRLLQLPAPVQRRVAAGVLSAGHARALLGLGTAEEQDRLAHRIVAEGLSVRAVEEIVATGQGSSEESPRRSARARPMAAGVGELAARLSDHFDTRVKVEVGRSRGKIVVEFASAEDLQRILATMAPSVPMALDGDETSGRDDD